MRGRSDSLVSDLSSIAKVRSVSKTSTSNFSSSQSRYEYTTSSTQQQNNQSSSNTQQSIKKNINDLDNLLSNLSSHNSGAASRTSSKPASREPSPGRSRAGGYQGYSSSHMSRTEERRERLMSNASNYRSPSLTRTPSQSRPQSRPPSRPHSPYNGGSSYPPRTPEPSQHEFSSQQMMTSTMRSNVSGVSSEFRPVHTTPDPLTGRYADGRITPNHGYTRNFTGSSPMPPRKATVPTSGDVIGIPKKPDELLSSLGHSVDSREIQRITQVSTLLNMFNRNNFHWSSGGDCCSKSKGEGAESTEITERWRFYSNQECCWTTSILSSRWVIRCLLENNLHYTCICFRWSLHQEQGGCEGSGGGVECSGTILQRILRCWERKQVKRGDWREGRRCRDSNLSSPLLCRPLCHHVTRDLNKSSRHFREENIS